MKHYKELTAYQNKHADSELSISLAGQHCSSEENISNSCVVPISEIKSNGLKSHYGNCRYCGRTRHMT